MKKKLLFISVMVIVLVLSLFAFTACNNDEGNGEDLVVNGSFTDFSNSAFDGWSASTKDVKFSQITTEDGQQYLKISNKSSQLSYVKQTIKVSPRHIYKVTVDMRINSQLSNKTGAYVAFTENLGYKFKSRYETTDGFTTYTFYVKPTNTDYLTLALCLEATGDVYFDNVSVQQVSASSVPQGEEVTTFRKVKTVNTNASTSGILFVVLLTLFSVAIIITAYILIRRIYASRNALVDFGVTDQGVKAKSASNVKWYQNVWFISAMLMLGAAAIRLVLLLTTYGMGRSMTDTLNLARNTLGVNNGVFNYMEKNPSSTYAPGTIYILAIVGAMTRGADITVTGIVLRLINILADMAVVAMIYGYGRKYVGNKLSTVYAGLYAVLPLTFVMSGMLNGFESLLVALIVGAMILMVNKKYLSTYLLMTLASVLDIRAMAIAPIVVAYFVYMYIRDNGDLKKFTANRAKIVFGLVGCFVLAYALTLPIGIHQIAAGDAFFNFKVMVGEITNTKFYTQNAFNLYGMVAMNGKTVIKSVEILNLIFLLVLEMYVVSLYFKNRNKQELLLLASFTFAVVAVATIKVTYTYLFIAIALGLMYTMVSGDKRMFAVIGGFATLGFLNIAQLINQSGFITGEVAQKAILNYETTNAFYITFCVISLLLLGYYAYVCYSITNNTKIVDISAMPEPFFKTVKASLKNLGKKLKKEQVAED